MPTQAPPTLIWFRQDLRIRDNAALAAAIARGRPIVPVFIRDWEGEGDWAPGGASRWWLHHALIDLEKTLAAIGLTLIFRHGRSVEVLEKLVGETGADAVYWNRRYEPSIVHRDERIKERLGRLGLQAEDFNSALLFEPQSIENKQGKPFQVFTPYWRHCLDLPVPVETGVESKRASGFGGRLRSDKLDDWKLLPSIPWDRDFHSLWEPTEAAGLRRLEGFVSDSVSRYENRRDLPSEEGTSRLSPYLHWGQMGPRQIAASLSRAGLLEAPGGRKYFAEIGWREFSHHLLYHFPETPAQALREEFADFPWSPDENLLEAWQLGRTGYPIVDAGMQELWSTGWMHNRVRMIAASILVKHLLQPWQAGARWFWDTLVDADLAANTQGWQWSAGCGADAAPYFRVFNPVLQGEKFDPEGAYVRRWVPALADVPSNVIHKPWEAGSAELKRAGVVLGKDYPYPVVPVQEGRDRALKAYACLKGKRERIS